MKTTILPNIFSTLERHSKPPGEERKIPMHGLDDLVSGKTVPAVVLSQRPLRRGATRATVHNQRRELVLDGEHTHSLNLASARFWSWNKK